jgi:hypothetical protein
MSNLGNTLHHVFADVVRSHFVDSLYGSAWIIYQELGFIVRCKENDDIKRIIRRKLI